MKYQAPLKIFAKNRAREAKITVKYLQKLVREHRDSWRIINYAYARLSSNGFGYLADRVFDSAGYVYVGNVAEHLDQYNRLQASNLWRANSCWLKPSLSDATKPEANQVITKIINRLKEFYD